MTNLSVAVWFTKGASATEKFKMTFKKLALVLGDSLYPSHELLHPDEDTLFFMAEDHGLCTHFRYHKQKLILFLSAMRSHADGISENWPITYRRLTTENIQTSYLEKLNEVFNEYPTLSEITTYEIEDHFFEREIKLFTEKNQVKLSIVPSPGFLTTRDQFSDYLRQVKKPFMHTFYQRQRRRLDILVDPNGNPFHGQWSFDEDNRKKLPKGIVIPETPKHEATKHTKEVIQLVDQMFNDHPGSTSNFQWATTRKQVLDQLDHFLKNKFQQFGPYEDAIDKGEVYLFHSVLSPYINMGLITPAETVECALKFAEENGIHYPSLEGFIRQIIGWREFIRGIYHEFDDQLNINHFGHARRMNHSWYEGTTGIPPLDDSIKKALKFSYTHHIERLMILGNIMLLCEIDPNDVYQWFMEMYIDSADWVMAPNVFGMSQFADGGIFATKPYIGGSNYILKMSNYPKSGEWHEIVNGLYWRFIHQNRDVFSKNQRMSMMVRTLDKMNPEKQTRLFSLAETFIKKVTTD